MCAVCMRSPCDSRCPNAPEPQSMDTCPECDEGIIFGDEYAEIDGMKYHVDCLESKDIRELLKLFDVLTYTVQEEDLE